MSDETKIYRLYCFDGERMTLTGDTIQAVNDAAAIAMAEAQGYGSKCEIWEGKRLVATLEAERRHA